MPVARVNDIELNYKLEGNGEDTIVLINGLGDDHLSADEGDDTVYHINPPRAIASCGSTTGESGRAPSRSARTRAGCSPTTRKPWPTRSALPVFT